MTNPIIDELHRIREAHAKRFNYDLDAILADLRRRDAKFKNLAKLKPLVPRSPSRGIAEAPAEYAVRRSPPKAKKGRTSRD